MMKHAITTRRLHRRRTMTPFWAACLARRNSGTPRAALGISTVMCVAVLAVLTGCSNPWKASFEPTIGADRDRFPPTQQVIVRQVPWERVDSALAAVHERVVTSDVHPDDWPPEDRAWAQTQLLRALQLDLSPDRAMVFGASSFATTDGVRPGDGTLAAFARSLGADYVIWADRYLGKTEAVVREPVQTTVWGGSWYRSRGRSRYHNSSYVETSWIPVTVLKDEIAYLAFYVRTKESP